MQQRVGIHRGLGVIKVGSVLAVTSLACLSVAPAFAADTWPSTETVATPPGGGYVDGQVGRPAITPDGRYLVFDSNAKNLTSTPDASSSWDVFLKNTRTGAVEKISTGLDGAEANGDSNYADITSDASFVVFASSADNLVESDEAGARSTELFVKNLRTGKITRIVEENLGSDGTFASPSISGNGSVVVFSSTHADLVPGDTNGVSDVFVWQRATGKISRISVSSAGAQGSNATTAAHGGSYQPKITTDGRSVVFRSGADNLVVGDTNEIDDIFVHTLATGRTTRVSVGPDGEQITGGRPEDGTGASIPSIADGGKVIAYQGYALKGLTDQDTGDTTQVYVYNVSTGKTEPAARTLSGEVAQAGSAVPQISPDGGYVAFQSGSSELVESDSGSELNVFVRRLSDQKITKASGGVAGAPANGPSGTFGIDIGAVGFAVVFDSQADNLVEGPASPIQDLYLHRTRKPI